MSTPMTGGEALVAQLEKENVDHVFAVPGQQLDHATDAFAKAGDRFRFITNRHEQASAYMADGYARASGKVGVCMVVPGPGLLNAMAALATAYACSSSVLSIVGQIPSPLIGRGIGVLHEVPRQSDLLDSVTKWHRLASRVDEIPGLVREAFVQLRSGRPRPVAIEIPPDVLAASAEVELIGPPVGEDHRAAPDPDLVARAAKLLSESRRPVIWVGSGVQMADATTELQEVCETLRAPVIMTRSGRGALSDRHPLALTRLSGRKAMPQADVVLVVGSRFIGLGGKAASVASGAKMILVDADPANLGEPLSPDLAILGDAKLFLAGLGDLLEPRRSDAARRWGSGTTARARDWADSQLAAIEPQMSYINALRSVIPDDGILVSDQTQVAYLVRIGYPFYAPRTNLTSGYQGTLGFALPVALGAKVAEPQRAVVALMGDGGFGWNMQELATARQYGIGVVTVIFNDNAYGNVRRAQLEAFEGRSVGTLLRNPDFVALASAHDILGRRVGSPAELAGAVADGIASGEPVIIEVPIGDAPSPWHLLG